MSINEKSYAYGASKSSIREIAAYGARRKQEIGPENVFDFSLGNPSVPAPDEVRDAIAHALTLPAVALHGYTPASGLPAAREAVANSLNRRFGTSYTAEDLYLTCGAAASISIVLNAIVNDGDEVIVIAPYFPEYRVFIENAGGVCVEVMADADTFQIDVDAVAAAITERTVAVMIDSPNNPVGSVYARANLEALAAALVSRSAEIGHDICLISDEPYREIAYDVEVPWVPDLYAYTVVCYSYSKSLSLPGERIGWVLVPNTNPDHDRLVFAVAGAGRKMTAWTPRPTSRPMPPTVVRLPRASPRSATSSSSRRAPSICGCAHSSPTRTRSSSVPAPSSCCRFRVTPSAARAGCAWATA